MASLSRSPLLCFGAPAVLAAALLGAAACTASHENNGALGGSGQGGGDLGFGGDDDFLGKPLEQEPPCEGKDPSVDNDGDGWPGAAGDCNDCTPQMNPGAQDYPGNDIDEDCNGERDDNPVDCDADIDLLSLDPFDGARAMGLCKMQHGQGWGVVAARYITADAKPIEQYDKEGIGWGVVPAFGPNVAAQEGAMMLVLSSGTARRPGDPGYDSPGAHDKGYATGSPPGYPKESPACPDVTTGEPHDSAGLRLVIKTPSNAKSLSFNLNFYTYEFPQYICSKFNDFFVAMLAPKPSAQADGNISYDGNGNTISVNAGFLQVCHAQDSYTCPLGPAQLAGTGFDVDLFGEATSNSAATGWLKTSTPIASPGQEITLDFAIWDSADGVLDSTVLLDNFQFGLDDTTTVTEPLPDPK